jgi:uncharacterized membrane protein
VKSKLEGVLDYELVAAASVVCGALAFALPNEVARLLFSLPLALFLPGYALDLAVFARGAQGRPLRLVLSVGLSLAMLALSSLVLNYVPGGIQKGSWVLMLVVVTLALCGVAWYRESPSGSIDTTNPWTRPGVGGVALLLAGVLLTAGAITLAFIPLPAGKAIGYTQFWLHADQLAGRAEVGITSDEQHPATYLLEGHVGDTTTSRRIELDPGQTRLVDLNVPASASGVVLPVEATLSKEGSSDDPYRTVSGWIGLGRNAG